MEVTALFKACVKTAKTKNKALGLLTKSGKDGSHSSKEKVNTVSKDTAKIKEAKELTSKAKEVTRTITHLNKFLLLHRKDYINASHLSCGIGGMTDAERDNIDQDAEKCVRTCSDMIAKMKIQFLKNAADCHMKNHQTVIIESLDRYLKDVCKLYSEQKAIRVKRCVDIQKLSRLEPEASKINNVSSYGNKNLLKNNTDLKHRKKAEIIPDYAETFEDISPEEMQMFDQENKDLYNELNSMVDEVKNVEGKVVEISRLQQIFTEKVLQQDVDMQRISEVTVGTTENIKDANEEIREAMKRNTGFRVWLLFSLLILSFTLLFLDWYNP